MIKLTENKIAVQAVPDPDKTPGGIIIPDEAKERSDQGIVKYIGPKVKDIKVGDYVLFSAYTGTTIQLPDDDGVLIVFREPFVMAIIGDDKKGGFDETEIPGLYFKEKQDHTLVLSQVEALLRRYGITDTNATIELFSIWRENNPYFPATYEQAIRLAAETIKNHPLAKSIALRDRLDPSKQAKPDIGYQEGSADI